MRRIPAGDDLGRRVIGIAVVMVLANGTIALPSSPAWWALGVMTLAVGSMFAIAALGPA